MTRDFTSHLLSFEEGVFANEHPFDMYVVRAKRSIRAINNLREQLEEVEAQLEEEMVGLRERMKKHA